MKIPYVVYILYSEYNHPLRGGEFENISIVKQSIFSDEWMTNEWMMNHKLLIWSLGSNLRTSLGMWFHKFAKLRFYDRFIGKSFWSFVKNFWFLLRCLFLAFLGPQKLMLASKFKGFLIATTMHQLAEWPLHYANIRDNSLLENSL